MNQEFEKWLETIRRRPLSPAEQSQLNLFLALHPAHREDWLQEVALTRVLLDLPAAPISPSFTERVMDRSGFPPAPQPRPFRWRFPWLAFSRPALGFALATLVLTLGTATLLVHRQRAQNRLAESVADLSRQIEFAAGAAELPAIELLQDFDAIYHLSQSHPLADDELLAALQ